MAEAQRILHPAWREELEATPYPFGDWATLANGKGPFLPEGTFLDAALYPINAGPHLRLSQVIVSQQTVVLVVGDNTQTEVCRGTLDLLAPQDDVPLVDPYGRPAGILVSTAQRLVIFQTWPSGTHTFTYAQTGFAAHVCLPIQEQCFRGFLLDDGTIVAGDIWLVGDDGIVLSHETAAAIQDECDAGVQADPQEQRIRVDIVGDPLFRQRLCATASATPRFLQTLTVRRGCEDIVCRPDDIGDIKLTAGKLTGESTILRIRSTGSGLRIETVGEVLQN